MRPTQYTLVLTILVSFCLLGQEASSQLGFPLQIKKSEEYEDRVLRSERSEQGKFKQPKRFIQNTVTHYNYFFNANNKLNEVLERAKSTWTDDYGKLLPFYNYTLDATARDSIQLDSIIYKASTGIALHDLRNDWVDNLYLLWGASYYLQKKFDSAYLMFQFINYAFAPKEKDGYYLTIGSKMDGNSAYSISSKEKGGLPRKMLSEPPSRNDAFIWQIRNFLIQDQFAEAASLIVTLRNDPNFPKRLNKDLHEVQAFSFYKQAMWDSAANHLVEALDNATNLQEKSRWEYLLGQLYERTGKFPEAEKYYSRVSSHTTDLVLDIYARLAAVRVNKDRSNSIEKNVEELMRMAKRDKYEEYRDIIYYMAAQMQLEGGNIDEAMKLLKKSTGFASNNPNQRNKAFFQLANISFDRGDYRLAKNYYDSIQPSGLDQTETALISTRKPPLAGIVKYLDIAERQDSLQHIASLPEEERKDFVKKLVKDLRKQQGLKDEPISAGPTITTPTLFPSVQPKGEWYFYNADFRARGLNDFKSKWGNRPNVDNWRRSSATQGAGIASNNSNTTSLTSSNTAMGNGLTYEELYNNLPLKPEQLALSDDSLKNAWFELGKLYIQDIEKCEKGVEVFEKLRDKFPQFDKMEEVLFNLYYCYNKNGETGKASAIKKLMNEKYPNGNLSKIVANGKDPNTTVKNEATKTYETIYDLFIEGKFDQAIAMKKEADNKYGQVYWTPQLLYIEAVYYARQRDDMKAKQILQSIVTGFAKSPLVPKALALISALNRRDQIEKELNSLVVTRDTTNSGRPNTNVTNPVTKPPVTNPPVTNPVVTQPKKDTIAAKPPVTTNNPQPKKDTVAVTKPPITHTSYTYDPNQPHFVGVVLNKIDPVFVNETKNAFARYNRDSYGSLNLGASLVEIDKDNKLLVLGPLPSGYQAVSYVDATKPKTPTEILPWLRGGKYSFIVFSEANLEALKNTKDIEGYKAFLNLYMPGKF